MALAYVRAKTALLVRLVALTLKRLLDMVNTTGVERTAMGKVGVPPVALVGVGAGDA